VPERQARLTKILKEAFQGQSKPALTATLPRGAIVSRPPPIGRIHNAVIKRYDWP
jgi:hypothetical protein